MAETPDEELRFDDVEYQEQAGAAGSRCATCERDLIGQYYTINGAPICTECERGFRAAREQGSPMARVAAAAGLGIAGGAIGAAVYFAILKLTGYEVGLVAILVGFLVGFGVRFGAQGRGGWGYQAMAVLLTYSAIVATYVPFIIEGFDEVSMTQAVDGETRAVKVLVTGENTILLNGEPVPEDQVRSSLQALALSHGAAWYHREKGDLPPGSAADSAFAAIIDLELLVLPFKDAEFTEPERYSEAMTRADPVARLFYFGYAFFLALASPFYDVTGNLIGLAIIAFALFQAWKMNRKSLFDVEGPFDLAGTRPAAP